MNSTRGGTTHLPLSCYRAPHDGACSTVGGGGDGCVFRPGVCAQPRTGAPRARGCERGGLRGRSSGWRRHGDGPVRRRGVLERAAFLRAVRAAWWRSFTGTATTTPAKTPSASSAVTTLRFVRTGRRIPPSSGPCRAARPSSSRASAIEPGDVDAPRRQGHPPLPSAASAANSSLGSPAPRPRRCCRDRAGTGG